VLSEDKRYTLRGTNEPIEQAATQSRIMLSGLQLGESVYGYTANAYLTNAEAEQATIVHFGGFVGQGNITVYLDIPDVASSLYLEGDFHDDFDMSINNNDCKSISVPSNPDPFTYLTREDLDGCKHLLAVGRNIIKFEFTNADIDNHYIGGGYLKATHRSDHVYTPQKTITETYYFSGIEGIFNLYDAIYVPGKLKNVDVYLHYLADHTESKNEVFFTIADEILFKDNSSLGEQEEHISDATIREKLDYDVYENKTIPIRMGYDNGTIEILASSIIDAVIVTDVSGSMNWEFNSSDAGILRSCDDDNLYDNSTRRISVAKCANNNFTNLIFSQENPVESNRIGLTSYNSNLKQSFDFSDDKSLVLGEIDGYIAGGGTCVCCGVLEAIRLFEEDMLHKYT